MIVSNIIRFFVSWLVQVLIFNHLLLGTYIYPAFYVYFILLLPFQTKGWVLLLSSFFLGLGVDFFSNSLGMHAAASVFMAFFRPIFIKILTAGKETDSGESPGLKSSSFSKFLTYAFLLILLHHSMLFFLEIFGFTEVPQTILRIGLSSITTLFLVLLSQLIFSKNEKR
ncbi:MAG: rod shape-determining protein MreD [Sphingobacteriia bacterium]|nr:rod shape-determining protein MreD [Sphingobacteriia bacterium]